MADKKLVKRQTYATLLDDLAVFIEQGRKAAIRQVNTILVVTYWLIGWRIVAFEQAGKKRAEYGSKLLEKLSEDLTKKFGKGFGYVNLNLMRQFFLAYSPKEILQRVSEESLADEKGTQLTRFLQTLSEESDSKTALPAFPPVSTLFNVLSVRFRLSWSHYCLLIRLEEPLKREFYEAEAVRGNWSVRQLDRQIQSMLYERTALSKRKSAVLAKAHKDPIILKPEDEVKDPYVLEFLGLRDEYSESQLEAALIKHLEHFLLELGIGFTFVARQKRIILEGSHYRLDLLFYHRLLQCLVAIDLKIGEFSHADAGQMNLYLNYLKDKEKLPGENDPIGLILCSDKKQTIVEYALGGLSNKIFASKYKLKLPDPELLKMEIEQERKRLLGMKIVEEG